MATEFPTRGQKAPQFWDQQLKDYIDGLHRPSVAVGFVGQSNEHGSVAPGTISTVGVFTPSADFVDYPQTFQSLRNPAVSVPLPPAVSTSGGYLCKVYDDLWDAGYNPTVVNGAIGSMGLVNDAAGFVNFWLPSQGFYARREPQNAGDRGYAGDLISPDGVRVWRCVKGQGKFAINNGPSLGGPFGYGSTFQDYISTLPGNIAGPTNLTTGPTQPAALTTPTPTRGQIVVESGGVEWQYEGTVSAPYVNAGNVCTEAQRGVGFDPLGILQRLHESMQTVEAGRKLVVIANGQTDLGATSARYKAAVKSVSRFYLNRGYEVLVGLTNYSAGSSNPGVNYPLLQTGKNEALAELQAEYGVGRVHEGADLYALMGTTGPMAAGGGFMQADNVHLNGRGAVGPALSGVAPAGKHVSDAIKAALD